MVNKAQPLLSLVCPFFNEEEGADHFFEGVIPELESITDAWEIVCVDDGSRDTTWAALKAWHGKDPRIRVLRLSRNFGKEAALTCGLDHAKGQAVIPIDADLQDPPDLIPELVAKWQEGFKVVLATRRTRPGDSRMKRYSAGIFYRLINKVSSIKIPENTGDFRLMDQEVVASIGQLRERTRFMKGIFAWAGYPTATVYYDRQGRVEGQSSWNYRKLWGFALDGLFSFTTIPLKVWMYLGAIISLLAFAFASFLILRTLFFGTDVPGYTSLMVAVLFMGGIQLVSLGIIGEYIGRIYRETKQRPLYVVGEKLG